MRERGTARRRATDDGASAAARRARACRRHPRRCLIALPRHDATALREMIVMPRGADDDDGEPRGGEQEEDEAQEESKRRGVQFALRAPRGGRASTAAAVCANSRGRQAGRRRASPVVVIVTRQRHDTAVQRTSTAVATVTKSSQPFRQNDPSKDVENPQPSSPHSHFLRRNVTRSRWNLISRRLSSPRPWGAFIPRSVRRAPAAPAARSRAARARAHHDAARHAVAVVSV